MTTSQETSIKHCNLSVPSLGLIAAALALLPSVIGCSASGSNDASIGTASEELRTNAKDFNRSGNILIADQFNNRVIEINSGGQIVWHFGLGPNDLSAKSILGVNDAQRVGQLTLMAGTGAPPGTEPGCDNGCADGRVLLVDRAGAIVWQYGQFGVTGAGANELNAPVQSTFIPGGDVLITDQGNQRVIEVSIRTHGIVWQYGTTGIDGSDANLLSDPNSAELLANGHVLIADEGNNRAIEVTRSHRIVAIFSAGGTVDGVAFASRLRNGNTLLTDGNNNRIVEVDRKDHVVWEYSTNTDLGSNPAPIPTRAVRLADGNTLISDQFNHRVIVVSPDKTIVATYGHINAPGYGVDNTDQGLNAPYDAKVIGDYTGLTPPFGRDFD